MMHLTRRAGSAATIVAVLALSACSSIGSLGNVLGSVFGGGGNQVDGTVYGVDTRNQQLALQQTNGQTVALQFDNNTRVLYQNRVYAVTSLDNGDQVSAYVQQLQNGGYYADSVVVVQPVANSTTTTGNSNVQALQGTVRQVNRTSALFTVDVGNGTVLTVTLPSNASSADVNRFNGLRSGDYVRFYGTYIAAQRVELRQFY